ncbi:tetratricopeptide repeat protein [Pelomyxa schiedti]|nr:tetratricopeptide repeat protein [Pelomyxa schiedti]
MTFQSDSEEGQKLQKLKDEVRCCGAPVFSYCSPEEAASIIHRELHNILISQFPKSTLTPATRDMLEQDAFVSTRSKIVVGLETTLRTLKNSLSANSAGFQTARSSSESGSADLSPLILVEGEAGSGKSTLLSTFFSTVVSDVPEVLPLAYFCGLNGSRTDLNSLLSSLVSQLSFFLGEECIDLQNKSVSNLAMEFQVMLFRASTRGPVLLLLSGLDQMENKHDCHELRWLPSQFPSLVTVIISANTGSPVSEVAKQRGFKTVGVPHLGVSDWVDFLQRRLAECGKSISESMVSLIATGLHRKLATPLYATLLLEELKYSGTFENLNDQVSYYLSANNTRELISFMFKRMEHEYADKNILAGVLCFIVSSRKGLREAELCDLLGIPQASLSRVMLMMRGLISRGKLSGLLTCTHACVREAAIATYASVGDRQTYCLRAIAAYFGNLWFSSSKKSNITSRVCDELPFALHRLGNWQDLALVLSNLELLEHLAGDDLRFELTVLWRDCADHIDIDNKVLQVVQSLESSTLGEKDCDRITVIAKFLTEMSRFKPAETLHMWALQLAKYLHASELNSASLAGRLENLAFLYREAGRFAESEPLYLQALDIRKSHPEAHEDLAQALNNLAILYRLRGKYIEAEPLYNEALQIREKTLGKMHPDLAQSYNSLACLYQDRGQCLLAETLYKKALQIRENVYGTYHPDTAQSLGNIGGLFISIGRYTEGEQFLAKALHIERKLFGPIHINVAQTLNIIAAGKLDLGYYDEALQIFQMSLATKEQLLGESAPEIALTCNDIAVLHVRRNEPEKAEPLYRRALEIRTKSLGNEHPDTAQSLSNLADLLASSGNTSSYEESEAMYFQALAIYEKNFGSNHPDVAEVMNSIANLYQRESRPFEEIQEMYIRALAVLSAAYSSLSFGKEPPPKWPPHPAIALTLNDLGVLRLNHNSFSDAEESLLDAAEVVKSVFGENHPDMALCYTNLADLYETQGMPERAEAMRAKTQRIPTSKKSS